MGLLSKLTVSAVGLWSKALLNLGYCSSVTVKGLDNLIHALEDEERNNGRGVITVANHISTLDDPVVWGVLPTRFYRSSRMSRWTLGASDMMFTNPVFSAFFRHGQVIETFRGKGIFQPAIDTAITKLNRGEWIHLFCEGKVNQDSSNVKSPNAGRLLRFKWGVGRILMESQKPPVIIPMWLTGFDTLMPEGRRTPYKFLPKPGVALSVTFGTPISSYKIQDALSTLVHANKLPEAPHSSSGGLDDPSRPKEETASGRVAQHGWLGGSVEPAGDTTERSVEIVRTRSALTALIQSEVEALGRIVLRLA